MTEEMTLRQWAIEAAIEAGAEKEAVLHYADQYVEYVVGVAEHKHDVP